MMKLLGRRKWHEKTLQAKKQSKVRQSVRVLHNLSEVTLESDVGTVGGNEIRGEDGQNQA